MNGEHTMSKNVPCLGVCLTGFNCKQPFSQLYRLTRLLRKCLLRIVDFFIYSVPNRPLSIVYQFENNFIDIDFLANFILHYRTLALL